MTALVILDGNTVNPGDLSWEPASSLVDEFTVYPRVPRAEILERIGDAELIMTNKTPIEEATLRDAPRLKYVGVLATGYNVVDARAATARGITVTNVPAYGTRATAQHALAMLLEISNRVGHHDGAIRDGAWKRSPDFCFWDYPLFELAGKTLGVIGYGAIGRAVGQIAAALGMRVLAFNGDRPPKNADENAAPLVNFTELLSLADVISLHCPLKPETEGIINRASISGMKDGVIILNAARGGLVVEEDLAFALRGGKVAYAAVDVLSSEPPRADNPLLGLPNCLITPHIAWAPRETRRRLIAVAADNLRLFLQGTPQNAVAS
ncbi:MAG: D-2-hydroxyacid dehydrogenase [Deltaproteobacteria bacterium]|jgi:glycerate dehydrogenase|nr:D-2-hydroxyacid dehydrogenase [Deltaproteobacteria bacterium]